MTYDKPFKTLDEQLDILASRGLTFHTREEAKEILMTYSYYDLVNGYKDIFMPDDVFKPRTRLFDLVVFSYLDKNVQAQIMKYSLIAETKFKNHIAYILSKNLGVHQDDYLNPKKFKKRVNKNLSFSSILDELNKQLKGGRDSRYPTKYYVKNHNHVPPWILFKNIPLGTAINLFESMNSTNKAEVSNMLLPCPQITTKQKIALIGIAMNEIRRFRNCTAHNLNFVRFRTYKNIPQETLYNLLPRGVIQKRKNEICDEDKTALRGVFGIILSLYVIIQNELICNGMIYEFTSNWDPPHEYAEHLYQEYLKIANVPLDVKKRLENLIT